MNNLKLNKIIATYILDHTELTITNDNKISNNKSICDNHYVITNAILYDTANGLLILADLKLCYKINKEPVEVAKNSHFFKLEEEFEKEVKLSLYNIHKKEEPQNKLIISLMHLKDIKEKIFKNPAEKADIERTLLYSDMKFKVLRVLIKKEIDRTLEKELFNLFEFFDSSYLNEFYGRSLFIILKNLIEELRALDDKLIEDSFPMDMDNLNYYLKLKYKENKGE